MNKKCSKCGEVKPLSEFNKSKSRKDRHADWCKECLNIYSKAYRKANPEKILAYNKAYRKANPEKILAYSKAYYKVNKEKLNDYSKEWAVNNPEKRKVSVNKNALKNKKELSDNYVKRLFIQRTSLTASDIPPELIEIKRQQLILKRLLKQQKELTNG